jgi:hypothetical protein
VNSQTYGDQYIPKVAFAAGDYLVIWTSLGQDTSMEGVYGQVLRPDAELAGEEFRLNTTWISRQIHPAIAADVRGRFVVLWSGFVGGINSFDLAGQRLMKVAQPLVAMHAPFVHAPFVVVSNAYQPRLDISWPEQAGLGIDHYEVYVDGAAIPVASPTTNFWTMTAADGLAAGTTHTFRVAYVTASTARSPLSPPATGKTWGGLNYYGVPVEWLSEFYGMSMDLWPRPGERLAPDGPTLLQVFLSGGSPTDRSTWLTTSLTSTPQGFFLSFNPQPGRIYQVQSSGELGTWSNLGGPRLAAETIDSLYVGRSNAGYYRVLLMR